MYLRECLIENVGPIEFFDLTLPFNKYANPKPVVLVGQNGSGKSIFLSYIVDALMEFAKQAYQDVVVGQGHRSPYFKLTGSTNQRANSPYGIGLLEFLEGEQTFSYVDKSGVLNVEDYREKMRGRFDGPLKTWPTEGNHKVVSQNENFFDQYFENNVVCYFPSTRHETPHWLNRESVAAESSFTFVQRLTQRLDKPIIVESSARENKRWILDVVLDSRVDLETVAEENPPPVLKHVITSNINDHLYLKQSRSNVEKLLQQVMQEESLQLLANYRNSTDRLSVYKQGQLYVPSLDHLSSGQANLFNTFVTIIRYADRGDISKSFQLHEIEGIVLIDEIDAHAHSGLQYEVLPKLFKLFPKVQFVVTSHSPLFLLGMEKEFGSDGFEILNMPAGQPITTERFSEFEKSWEYFRETKAYEEDLERALAVGERPLVFTEGETDLLYIRTALELLNRQDILEGLQIDWIGRHGPKGPLNTGSPWLDQTKKVIEANTDLTKRRVLLLYDFDTKKAAEDNGPISVRSIPRNPGNSRIKKGIENLFPPELFEERFYTTREIEGDYGEPIRRVTFEKMKFCKWMCEERRSVEDFKGFSVVVDLLERFLQVGSNPTGQPEVGTTEAT